MITSEPTTSIGPGIYPGMPMDVYQNLPAIGSHRLHALKRSPLHCLHSMTSHREPTPALLMGSLVNAMLLEDAAAVERFAVAETCVAKTATGSRCTRNGSVRVDGEWRCGQHAKNLMSIGGPESLTIVTQDIFDAAGACVLAIRKHPKAREFIDARTDTEVSVVWEDKETGLLCKARPDFLVRPSILFDLKTTARGVDRAAFERSIFDFGYHCQSAHYQSGLAANGIDITDAGIVCVESKPPHATAVYQFEDDVIEWGKREVRALLDRYLECAESGEWPGPAGEKVQLVGLPKWAKEYAPQLEAD